VRGKGWRTRKKKRMGGGVATVQTGCRGEGRQSGRRDRTEEATTPGEHSSRDPPGGERILRSKSHKGKQDAGSNTKRRQISGRGRT